MRTAKIETVGQLRQVLAEFRDECPIRLQEGTLADAPFYIVVGFPNKREQYQLHVSLMSSHVYEAIRRDTE